MRAALGRHQRVNLVDDDRVDAAERLAGVRREQQVERFGRRDENVGRLALESGPFALRRVAGPDGDRRASHTAIAARAPPVWAMPVERRAQVALDVRRQRLERRDVQHAATVRPSGGSAREHQPIEAPKKGGERFSAAGRRQDQRRFAAGDGGQPERLRPGRRVERAVEPCAYGGMKRLRADQTDSERAVTAAIL